MHAMRNLPQLTELRNSFQMLRLNLNTLVPIGHGELDFDQTL